MNRTALVSHCAPTALYSKVCVAPVWPLQVRTHALHPRPYTVNTATSTITVTAPPAAQHGMAPRGDYVLWLLGDEVGEFGKTYSQGHWVTLKEAVV
ncbi:hypothetical protein CHLRE_13g577150v5 [Chlamydomonas reinhardtii]|uniref:Uncharacterized protein n=1 Tax=Chlamydomonas reinhardtii TaxID=3055 RepID=A0A2K3D028_CHLRE|nr:uncharacterized protein CHLRE_13g577150v5 [Chlamydomonas reinhardtii]PNW73895.1 hypothetical protein CHLRE_13g577150v5 [Chlamydomonas reinhardtii]